MNIENTCLITAISNSDKYTIMLIATPSVSPSWADFMSQTQIVNTIHVLLEKYQPKWFPCPVNHRGAHKRPRTITKY